MSNCCAKPISKIINIGGIEVDIKGLDNIFQDVYSSHYDNDEQLIRTLFQKLKEHGNYVSPKCEEMYKDGILREYRKFRGSVQKAIENREQTTTTQKKRRWYTLNKGTE